MILLHLLVFCIACWVPAFGGNRCSCSLPPEESCGNNATLKSCPNPCQATCWNPVSDPNCPLKCIKRGCECKPGYVWYYRQCILREDCPAYFLCGNDRNTTYISNPNPCPPTCRNREGIKPCTRPAHKKGCQCMDNYYVNDEGKCVRWCDCPESKSCGTNATFKYCPNPCPGTCDNPDGNPNCKKKCDECGCECKNGYVFHEGKCILREHCPDYLRCHGDRNTTFTTCPNPCPRTCRCPEGKQPCTKQCLKAGCQCIKDYFVNDEGNCVLWRDCHESKVCGKNATYKCCPNQCPGTCSNPAGNPHCDKKCNEGGCECDTGHVLHHGKCILTKDCPDYLRCGGDRNATYTTCPNPCPPTCQCPNGIKPCTRQCPKEGCSCKEGYYRNADGKCVLWSDCRESKICGKNASYVSCPNPCPGTCSNPAGFPCKRKCDEYGCQCNNGTVLHNGKCILLKDCPDYLRCNGDRNATYKSCPNPCPPTCRNSDGNKPCATICPKEGCECKDQYVKNDHGKCVLRKDCPNYVHCGSNATYTSCGSACPLTCKYPNMTGPCPLICVPGCACKEHYYLDVNGNCVHFQDCPSARHCKENEHFVYCAFGCPCHICPENDKRDIVPCPPPERCMSGCICKDGFLRRSRVDDTCIPASQCRPVKCTRQYEVWSRNPPPHDKICAGVSIHPEKRHCHNRPRCVCQPGFCRNASGICVPIRILQKCGYNEMPVKCKTTCPPQSCEISYTEYACDPLPPCVRGCDCLPDHLRNASGICIPNEKCPPPPTIPICDSEQNEILSSCAKVCPPQTCQSIYAQYKCMANITCKWGCDCLPGYLRDCDGICIPREKCPTTPGCPVCSIPVHCRPTCAVPNPPGCPYTPSQTNHDGCNCKIGYILSKIGGKCINITECPPNVGCNGDANAVVKQYPEPCPSTCEAPENYLFCKKKPQPVGCVCKPGTILSDNGKCILPENCPYGNPCGPNGTFVPCKYTCQSSFCPMNDSRVVVACKPPRAEDCRPGCLCKLNYRFRSPEDQTCIRADECPPLNCPRYEKWTPCPNPCDSGYCEEVDKPKTPCYTFVLNCNPQCTCIDNYFRNRKDDRCVSARKCRKINANEECDDDDDDDYY